MACADESRNLRQASCWKVDVMNGAAGRRRYGLDSTEVTAKFGLCEIGGQPGGLCFGDAQRLVGLGLALRIEVATGGDALAVETGERGRERTGFALVEFADLVEGGTEVPVARADEAHALPLALDHDARGHALHAPGRQAGHDFFHSTGDTS